MDKKLYHRGNGAEPLRNDFIICNKDTFMAGGNTEDEKTWFSLGWDKARQMSAGEVEELREQVRKLRECIDLCDNHFAHLEDFTHGEAGKAITQIRGMIQQLLKETE